MSAGNTSTYCMDCPLRNRTRVPFVGPKHAEFAIVGECPGRMEVFNGKPFIGPSGDVLNALLRHLGIDRDNIRIGNVILCGVIGEEDRDEPWFGDVLERCRRRRIEEGDLENVKAAVALGSVAAWGLSGEAITLGGSKPRRGAYHRAIDGFVFFPTWHPAAILRSGGASGGPGLSDAEAETIAYDIDKAYEYAQGKRELFSPNIITTGDPVEFANWCSDVPPGVLAIDLEATSINPLDCKVTVVGLAKQRRGYDYSDGKCERFDAISFWYPNDRDGIAFNTFNALMRRKDLIKTAHNLSYDFTVIERLFTKIEGPIHDTMLAHHAAFPDCKSDLGSVAHTHLVIDPWKYIFHNIDKKYKDDSKFNDESYVRSLLIYNAKDVSTTASLYYKLRKACIDRKVEQIADIDTKMADIARKMTEYGVPIDQTVREKMKKEFSEGVKKAEERMLNIVFEAIERNIFLGVNLEETEKFLRDIQKRANANRKFKNLKQAHKWKVIPGWSPSSSDMLAKAYDMCGVRLPSTAITKTGKRSVGKATLVEVAEEPIVEATIDFRRSLKMYGMYFDSDEFVLDQNSRLHTAWKIHGTPTGRWSSGAGKDPGMGDIGLALQNWPKLICKMVRAPEGYKLVGVDYSQLEYRGIALLAGEDVLLDIFNDRQSNRDLHSENAARLWLKAWDSCDPEKATSTYAEAEFKKRRFLLRLLTKTGLYASLYGAVAETVRRQLRASSFRESDLEAARALREITLETCQMFVDAVPRLWPNVARWREQAIRDARETQVIVCPVSGRRRVWPLGMVDPTQAVNNRVQTLAAAIMNSRFILLPDLLPKEARIILQVHDSVVVECPEHMAEDVLHILETTMRTSLELNGKSCFFDVKGSIGQSWDQV